VSATVFLIYYSVHNTSERIYSNGNTLLLKYLRQVLRVIKFFLQPHRCIILEKHKFFWLRFNENHEKTQKQVLKRNAYVIIFLRNKKTSKMR